MKAVTKFKSLLGKKRPADTIHTSGKASPSHQSTHELAQTPEAASVNDATLSRSNSIGVVASGHASPVVRSQAASPWNSEISTSGDWRPKHPQRILTSSSDKSHAHDPLLDEPLYLGIGAGKDNFLDTHSSLEVPEDEPIAESPLAAEFSIYDVAYRNEVDRIKQAQGHGVKVYSNRQVNENEGYKTDSSKIGALVAKTHNGRAQLLQLVREKVKDAEKGNLQAGEQEDVVHDSC